MQNHSTGSQSGGRVRQTNKRQAIMQAAELLFTSRRFHEMTMEDVATAAKVAKGTLYGYFRDKEDLFFQTCTSGIDELCEFIAAIPADRPFERQLLAACREISKFYDRRHQLLWLVQAEEGRMDSGGGSRNGWKEKRERLVATVTQVLARGVENGALRDDVSLEVLANILMSMLRARSRRLSDAPPKMRRHEVILDLFCRGAGSPPK